MKRFVFRLQRLLHLREQAEEARARDLGEAAAREAKGQSALDHALEHLDTCRNQAGISEPRLHTAGELRTRQLTVEAAQVQADAAKNSHRGAEEVLAAAREEFTEARRERRVLERLEERGQEAWHEESEKADQAETDEISQRLWWKRGEA